MKEYIERSVAIQSIKNEDDSHLDDYYRAGLFESEMVIKNLPAADVAPVRHGEWIEYSGDPNIITCSECDWGTSPEEKGFKYCPHCGARMDGGNSNA